MTDMEQINLKVLALVTVIGLGVAVWSGLSSRAYAQVQTAPVVMENIEPNRYERASRVWHHTRVADGGVGRGEEIYRVRCWTCHNEYALAADPTGPPSLRDVPKRLTDEMITMQIRNGSARMAAYTTATLSERDLADLLLYMREKCGTYPTGGGCVDEHNPPRNPDFRAEWVQVIP